MATEPITLFARNGDLAGIVRLLREVPADLHIVGPDDAWQEAVVTISKGKKKRKLTFSHDPTDYAEPHWSTQMSGMRGYFARFPDSDRKQRVLLLTTTF